MVPGRMWAARLARRADGADSAPGLWSVLIETGETMARTIADLLAGHYRLAAVRAHLLEMAGDYPTARASYQLAARRTTSLPERRYLETRAARLPQDDQQ